MSVSNNHGRVLEYLIVEKIKEQYKENVVLTEQTVKDQERDKQKLNGVESKILDNMEKSSMKISNWLKSEVGDHHFMLHRLTDFEGTQGDVTDIRVSIENGIDLNLSIKHNHLAIKHQRPGPTPQHLGFSKGSTIDKEFRKNYKKIFDDFRTKSLLIKPKISKYNEISDHIPDLLYFPMCSLISGFINNHGVDKNRANHYLNFLIGNTQFKKIIVHLNGNVEILSFDDIPNCELVTSTVLDKSYVDVDFHNGIELRMRLHTASSRFCMNSLKFDTQPKTINIPSITI